MPLVSTLTAGALSCQSMLRMLPMYDFLIHAAKVITKIYDKKQIFDKHFTFKYVAEMLPNPTGPNSILFRFHDYWYNRSNVNNPCNLAYPPCFVSYRIKLRPNTKIQFIFKVFTVLVLSNDI